MTTAEARNIAVVYSSRDKRGKHDATGAFIPEVRKFQAVHGVPQKNMLGVDCISQTTAQRRGEVIDFLSSFQYGEPLDGLAIFCHGWPNGIQIGFRRENISELATVLGNNRRDYLEIVLYACLTAENDVRDNEVKRIGPATQGGFADSLSLALARWGVSGHVDAHKKSGHTTWCPWVIRFFNRVLGIRASWLVEPGSQFWHSWCNAVRSTKMRFQFPFMTELEIKNKLSVVR